MPFNEKGKFVVQKQELNFPNLINEGREYGLSERQLSKLQRYLNDKRLLRVINLETFNRNAKAWLAALTGIVADVLAMDAHVSIWLDKKLEKPRNWVLDKLTSIIPTKIDDVAMKTIQLAQQFTDDQILPLKEKVLTNISSKMHDKYNYHENANYLGYSLKELKNQQEERLKESKAEAQDAIKTLNRRKFETAIIRGYHDKDDNFVNKRKYKDSTTTLLLKSMNNKRKGTNNERTGQNKQEISEEQKTFGQDEGKIP